jgi:hypothetical protein
MNCLVDVNVSVPNFSVEGYGFNLCSGKTKTKRLIFVAKHAALGIKSKYCIRFICLEKEDLILQPKVCRLLLVFSSNK